MSRLLTPELIRPHLAALDLRAAMPEAAAGYLRHYGLAPASASVAHRLGRVAVQGYEVVTQLWCPAEPAATLLVLHGYYDHMGLYGHVVRWGLEMGFAVLGCDLPGHGLSSGPRASIGEFAEYQAVLAALLDEATRLDLPRPWHLLGQSTGGAIAIDHLLHAPHPALGQSILLAPLVRPRAWRRSRLSYRLLRPFVEQLPRRFSDNSGDPAFLRFVREDPLQADTLPASWVGALDRWIARIEQAPASPAAPLVVQGEQDLTVDWRYNLPVLARKFDRPEVLRLPEARHHLVNEQAALRQRYFDFLRERLG